MICLRLQQIGLLSDIIANKATRKDDREAAAALIAEISMIGCDDCTTKTPDHAATFSAAQGPSR